MKRHSLRCARVCAPSEFTGFSSSSTKKFSSVQFLRGPPTLKKTFDAARHHFANCPIHTIPQLSKLTEGLWPQIPSQLSSPRSHTPLYSLKSLAPGYEDVHMYSTQDCDCANPDINPSPTPLGKNRRGAYFSIRVVIAFPCENRLSRTVGTGTSGPSAPVPPGVLCGLRNGGQTKRKA